MSKFDISKIDQKLLEEIRACKKPEELKALFAAKCLEVPDSKLEAILKLSEKASELDLEDLKLISGGCCDRHCITDGISCLTETCDTECECINYYPCDLYYAPH